MKLEFIRTQLSDPKFQSSLATVVEDPQSLLPQSEDDLHLFGKPILPLWNLDSV